MALTFQSATETTATLSYSASFNLHSGAYNKTYSGNIGGTSVSSSYGTVTVYSLKQGQPNSISGSITCYYQYDITTTTTTTNADGSTTTTTTTTTHNASATSSIGSIIVYTHPGAWHWSDYISKNDIIEKKLTYTLVNQWVDHLAAWKSWDTQANWYSAYDDYYNPNSGTGYRVNSKDIIYLQWFNNCARAHPRASTISHNNNEDIISVSRLSTLDFNGT